MHKEVLLRTKGIIIRQVLKVKNTMTMINRIIMILGMDNTNPTMKGSRPHIILIKHLFHTLQLLNPCHELLVPQMLRQELLLLP